MIRSIKMRYKIDDHDFEVRLNKARRFLKAGDTVEVIVIFRGREFQKIHVGREQLNRFASTLRTGDDKSYPVSFVIERPPARHGRDLKMILRPYTEEKNEKVLSQRH